MPKDIAGEFARGFEGMTENPVSIDELYAARDLLIANIVGKMPDAHRRFLISFERGKPDWNLLGIASAQDLAAVKWRQQNLDKLDKNKRAALVSELEAVLSA